MKLGAFSVSLSVKDIARSLDFYQKLGFKTVGGDAKQNWLILRNAEQTTIGLFQGMFEGNILTFNPGWDGECNALPQFDDVRSIQARLESSGLTLETRADVATSGPASITMRDPDGNAILIDQHR